MNRRVKRLYYNTSSDRILITLCSAACSKSDHSSVAELIRLFQSVCTNPELMSYGSYLFDSAKIYHDGIKWIVESEILVPKETT